jgi:cystathionine beta-lyase
MTKVEGSSPAPSQSKQDTKVTTAGRKPFAHHGYVNTPVYHASTLLYPSAEDFEARQRTGDESGKHNHYFYGRRGTPTSEALELALQEIEGPACAGVALLPSGLTAISTALLCVLKTGDHLLVTDSVYGPARRLCDTLLSRYGVQTTYYDPHIGANIADHMLPNTRAVYLESPGSLTFEVQDVPAIAEAAHRHGAVVLMDDTWAGPLNFKALEKGVDLSIQSGSKYIGGHSDLMLGTVSANAQWLAPLKDTTYGMGLCVGPDDMNLALRGLRTLSIRLARHHQSALIVARWLEQRPEVSRVLYPALPSDPGYALWRRDFTGACGLFAVVLKPIPEKAVFAFLNTLTLFGLGVSWGGFESLAIGYDASESRSATRRTAGGPSLRFHIGLEDPGDLLADLERAFAALAATR